MRSESGIDMTAKDAYLNKAEFRQVSAALSWRLGWLAGQGADLS